MYKLIHYYYNDHYDFHITISDTGEYEFIIKHNNEEYWGSSFLAGLKHIDEFQKFLDNAETEVELIDDKMILTIEVPYSKKKEIIYLHKPQLFEIESKIDVLNKIKCRLSSRISELETYLLKG